ncbi:MAG: hypothetical protein PHD47_00565 [Acholeplasmataceae bacterium]|nr:hypothetical protein [Acholeplasmataceae bacterium]
MTFLYGVLVVAAIVVFYIVISYYNGKTEVPESCEQAYHEAQDCSACGSKNSCGIRKAIIEMKETNL